MKVKGLRIKNSDVENMFYWFSYCFCINKSCQTKSDC